MFFIVTKFKKTILQTFLNYYIVYIRRAASSRTILSIFPREITRLRVEDDNKNKPSAICRFGRFLWSHVCKKKKKTSTIDIIYHTTNILQIIIIYTLTGISYTRHILSSPVFRKFVKWQYIYIPKLFFLYGVKDLDYGFQEHIFSFLRMFKK